MAKKKGGPRNHQVCRLDRPPTGGSRLQLMTPISAPKPGKRGGVEIQVRDLGRAWGHGLSYRAQQAMPIIANPGTELMAYVVQAGGRHAVVKYDGEWWAVMGSRIDPLEPGESEWAFRTRKLYLLKAGQRYRGTDGRRRWEGLSPEAIEGLEAFKHEALASI